MRYEIHTGLGGWLLLAVILSSCASGGRYLGPEYYYTEDGVEYSCRVPEPFLGGNCRPESEWAK